MVTFVMEMTVWPTDGWIIELMAVGIWNSYNTLMHFDESSRRTFFRVHEKSPNKKKSYQLVKLPSVKHSSS